MLELLQITNDPAFARRCDAIDGIRMFVDLESLGKAQRQAGHNTFLSAHELEDVARIKAVLTRSQLMVRVNPMNPHTAEEIEAVLARGADMVMLPMFHTAHQLHQFCSMVAGRVPVVALLETPGALRSVNEWVGTPGLTEVHVGLNDLHLSMSLQFMFEPLAMGLIEPVAAAVRNQGLRFGIGGIARLDEGLLPGRDVLAEHVRLGSQAVILSRTFHRAETTEMQHQVPNPQVDHACFEDEIAALRHCEQALSLRSPEQTEIDRLNVWTRINHIAQRLAHEHTTNQPLIIQPIDIHHRPRQAPSPFLVASPAQVLG